MSPFVVGRCQFIVAYEMERQVFDLLWPLFGFGRYLGFFPCKRIVDPETCENQLKPVNWKIQLILFIIFGGIFCQIGVISYQLILQSNVEEANIFDCMETINPAISGSFVDKLALYVMPTVAAVVPYLAHWGNYKMRKGLCLLSQKCMRRSSLSDRRILKPFLAYFAITAIFCISASLITFYTLSVCFQSIALLVRLMVSFGSFFAPIMMHYSYVVFLGAFLEVALLVIDNCEKLKSIKYDHQLTSYIDIAESLEIASNMFQFNNFYVVTSNSIQIMVLLYIIIYHLVVNLETMSESLVFFLLFDTLTFFTNTLLLCFINFYSHKVAKEIHGLRRHLKASTLHDNLGLIDFDGKQLPASLVKSCIEERLDEFRGFDGKGYFILGKSFLKTLIAFCFTYLVILIQFKMNESPYHDND